MEHQPLRLWNSSAMIPLDFRKCVANCSMSAPFPSLLKTYFRVNVASRPGWFGVSRCGLSIPEVDALTLSG